MILTKFGQRVNEMMAFALKKVQNFLWSRCFLIIRQIVNMASNAILNRDGSRGHKHSYKIFICLCFGHCC